MRSAAPQEEPDNRPVIILVRPQLAENIGMCARAMMNFGLSEMRLVAPRDGWPKKGAHAAASGAAGILRAAKLFDRVEDAVGDLNKVYATTARERGQIKPTLSAEQAALEMHMLASAGSRVGILFGPERVGLSNDDVALADAILSFPVNPDFSSVNLAQAVLLVAYERWKLVSGERPPVAAARRSAPAKREHVLAFFEYLESQLDEAAFFNPLEKRSIMVRNLRNIWHRLAFSEQDVQTLRGVVSALVTGRRGRRMADGAKGATVKSIRSQNGTAN